VAVNQMWDAGDRPTDIKTRNLRVIPWKDDESDPPDDKK
jgi:hypothetical protein